MGVLDPVGSGSTYDRELLVTDAGGTAVRSRSAAECTFDRYRRGASFRVWKASIRDFWRDIMISEQSTAPETGRDPDITTGWRIVSLCRRHP